MAKNQDTVKNVLKGIDEKSELAEIKQGGFSSYVHTPEVLGKIRDIIGEERAKSVALSIVQIRQLNPKLKECEPVSIITAVLQGEVLNLPVGSDFGYAYAVPYKSYGGKSVAQFQLGYKGIIQLAIRSGAFATINVIDVREGELIGVDRLRGNVDFAFNEDHDKRMKLPVIGYVAYFELKNGFFKFNYWTVERVKAHAKKYSKAYQYDLSKGKKSSPWSTEFDAMAMKTVLKNLIVKWGPMNIEMQKALGADQAVRNTFADLVNGTNSYVDNEDEPYQPDDIDIDVAVVDDDEPSFMKED